MVTWLPVHVWQKWVVRGLQRFVVHICWARCLYYHMNERKRTNVTSYEVFSNVCRVWPHICLSILHNSSGYKYMFTCFGSPVLASVHIHKQSIWTWIYSWHWIEGIQNISFDDVLNLVFTVAWRRLKTARITRGNTDAILYTTLSYYHQAIISNAVT